MGNPCRDLTALQVRQLIDIAKVADVVVEANNFKKTFSEAFENGLRAVVKLDNQSTSQPEKDGVEKSIGNDYANTRNNGPDRHPG